MTQTALEPRPPLTVGTPRPPVQHTLAGEVSVRGKGLLLGQDAVSYTHLTLPTILRV